jgi:hypothetical protein
MPTPPPPEHTRWAKGVSGNPGGRPKKRFTDVLERRLDTRPDLVEGFITVAIQNALKGDFRFWSAIYDRVEGKLANPISVEQISTDDYGILVELPKPEVTDGKENITSGD